MGSQTTTVKTLTEHPLQDRAFVQNHILKDASFSSYIKPEENNNPDDSEINVFDAKKYFSESNESSPPEIEKNIADQCGLPSSNRHSSVSSVDNNSYGRNFRVNSFRATPTASSEASWNSQTGLLANPPGAIAVSLRGINSHEKKRGSFNSTRKWFFRQKCPCSGKNSVEVEETSSEPRTEVGSVKQSSKVIVEKSINMSLKNNSIVIRPQSSETHVGPISKIGTIERRSLSELSESTTNTTTHVTIACQQRVLAPVRPFTETTGGGFSFPILNNSDGGGHQAKLRIKHPPTRSISPILEDPPRESLEVFQPYSRKSTEADHHHNNKCTTNFPFPISRVDDDVASDASSDLFEIESLSTSSCQLYRQRNSLEEPGTPTECYAPSEVSIDWSVTTAEGFERASVTNYSSISEIEMNTLFFGNGSGGGGDGGGKWKGSGLLSCRHEKAVNVGPSPQPVKYGSPDGPPHTAGHVGRANKPPLASSHSARLSLAFAA